MAGRRFLWLDGSRGIAAILVMIYHFAEYLKTGSLFKSSYLSVDLFFVMSGFVLTHAYERKLLAGMTFGRFFAIRMIRLYPVYAAATALGLSYYAAKIVLATDDAPTLLSLVDIATLNAFFIPNHDATSVPLGMFPFAPTSWSLSIELVVSVLFATIFYRMKRQALSIVSAVSAACFVLAALHYRTVDLGWDARTFPPSLFRATAEFAAGMLIYHAVASKAVSGGSRWQAMATFAVLIGAMVFMSPGIGRSLLVIAILFPLVLYVQASSEPAGWVAWLCSQLGRGSYPIYLLHTPVLLWGAGLAKMLAPDVPGKLGPMLGVSLVVATLVISYLIAALLDEPLRRHLSMLIHRRYPGAPVYPRHTTVPLPQQG